MCGIPIMSTYGEMKIFAQFDVYMLLLFFSFSYIMIDIGLHMVNGEIRAYMQVKREEMALLKKKKIKLDDTLDQERYSNVARKSYILNAIFRYGIRLQRRRGKQHARHGQLVQQTQRGDVQTILRKDIRP
jgi:hypothetical protein